MEIQTIKISAKGQISIPKEIRERMNLRVGEKLVLMEGNNQLVLQKTDELLNKLGISNESRDNMLASQDSLKKEQDNLSVPSMEEMFKQADRIKNQKEYTTKELMSMIHKRRARP